MIGTSLFAICPRIGGCFTQFSGGGNPKRPIGHKRHRKCCLPSKESQLQAIQLISHFFKFIINLRVQEVVDPKYDPNRSRYQIHADSSQSNENGFPQSGRSTGKLIFGNILNIIVLRTK